MKKAFVRYDTRMSVEKGTDFESIKTPFECEGDNSILPRLREQAKDQEGAPRTAGLFVFGGVMRIASGMGQLKAFEHAGIQKTLRFAVGVSAGVLGASYALTSKIAAVESILLDACCNQIEGKPFIEMRRTIPRKLNLDVLRSLWEGNLPDAIPLKVHAIPEGVDLLICTARTADKTSAVLVVDRHNEHEAHNMLQAAISLRVLTQGSVSVTHNGVCDTYEDLVPYAPVPVAEILDIPSYANVNDIVVIANVPKDFEHMKDFPDFEKKHLTESIAALKEYCGRTGKRYLILYASPYIGSLQTDREHIDSVMGKVHSFTERLIHSN